MIVSTAILGAALLLSGDVRLPVSLPATLLMAVGYVPAPLVRPDADAPVSLVRGDMVEDENDDSDDTVEAQLAPSITAFGVGAGFAISAWLPRHGVFRASGRCLVLRC